MAMLPGRWRPLDDGPRQVMAMAVSESPGPCPTTVLRTTGRKPTLSLLHDVIAGFSLDEILDRTGIDRVRLHRYRRGETWPSWDTQRHFRELLATDPVANLRDPLPRP